MLHSEPMNALFYPFHLCHEQTLHQLLADFKVVHFRDFMALQLTPFLGTTAFPDRMGDYFPELVKTGRIVQGHNVSGPMNTEMVDAIDRDLSDPYWRSLFHDALSSDYRFQRGLFEPSQMPKVEKTASGEHSFLSKLIQTTLKEQVYKVETVQNLSRAAHTAENGLGFEYGLALIKTSASLCYTIRLCSQLNLVAVTDSSSHHQLLTRSCEREGTDLGNFCLDRKGY